MPSTIIHARGSDKGNVGRGEEVFRLRPARRDYGGSAGADSVQVSGKRKSDKVRIDKGGRTK